MPLFDARDLLAFPGGDNATDTVIGGIHFNLTTLDFWNYTLYSNGTLSNESWCLLTFEPYTPKLVYANGSFLNATWCYDPVRPIGLRAGVGVGFACAFGLGLVLTLATLAKHGKLYLPVEKRFFPIGRRWQWYWAIWVCAMGFISLITNVDVDRYYLPELPLVLTTFFWFLMQMGALSIVWEAVRHWGSWMERQFIDEDPFRLSQDDRRANFEFWLPLFYYFWFWLNFFLIVPRNWGALELQRSPEQTLAQAQPMATDGRFKAAAFCLLVGWLTIAVSLRHSIKHYVQGNRGILSRVFGVLRHMPVRFVLLLTFALAIVAYQALSAWEFQYSPLNVNGSVVAMYVGGYLPSLLIVWFQALFGLLRPNEDRELIRQRRMRGDAQDRELGIVRKPAWWRRVNGEVPVWHSEGNSMRDRIARNVREIGGGHATARGIERAVNTRIRETEAAARAAERAGLPLAESLEMGEMRRTDSQQTLAPGAAPGFGPVPSGASTTPLRPGLAPFGGKSDRRRSERAMQVAASLLFPDAGTDPDVARARAQRHAELMQDGPPPPYQDRGRSREQGSDAGTLRPGTSERTPSTGTINSISQQPQQVRSMLDI